MYVYMLFFHASGYIVSTDLVIEFLEVAFNNILYSRKLYPAELFVEKKIYASASYVSQHPELNEYLDNVLKAIRQLIVEGNSSVGTTVNLDIFNKNKCLVEKYVFNLSSSQFDDRPPQTEKDPYFMKFEQHLRKVCLKLSLATSYLIPLPDDSTFTINVETSQRSYVAFSENSSSLWQHFPWIICLDNETRKTNYSTITSNRSMLPLAIIQSRHIQLEMFLLVENNAQSN